TVDVDVLLDPAPDAFAARRIVTGERAVLDARPPAAALLRERQRPLHDQDPIVEARAHLRAFALLVGARPPELAHRPVDLVHDLRLAGIGSRGEREVGVAAGLEQQR